MFQTPTLFYRLLLYLLFLSVIPILAMGLRVSAVAGDALREEVAQSTAQIIASRRDYLGLELRQLETVLTNLANIDGIVDYLLAESPAGPEYTDVVVTAQMGYTLNTLNAAANLRGLVSLCIYTVDGRFYHVGGNAGRRFDAELAQRLYNSTQNAKTRLVWLGLEPNIQPDSPYKQVVVISKALNLADETGQPLEVAVFMANYSLEALAKSLSEVNLGAGSDLLLLDQDSQLLYHTNTDMIGSTYRLEDLLLAKQNSGYLNTTVQGVPSLLAYATLPQTNWQLVGIVPISTIEEAIAPINMATIVVMSIAFAMIGITVFVLNLNFLKPVRDITFAFRGLARGQANIEPLPPRRGMVIGQLIEGFNTYLSVLKAREYAERNLQTRNAEREELIRQLKSNIQFRDAFLATITHELRTPLSAIQGFAGLMQLEPDIAKDADLARMNSRIIANGQRLLRLIDDIIELSNLNANRLDTLLTAVSPQQMLKNWCDDFKLQAEAKGLSLSLVLANELPTEIITDELRLGQVAANLLHNALKFTAQGSVTLRAGVGSGTWYFQVTDTGIGIDPEWHKLIFEEFRQVDSSSKRKYGGAGLGLAIVKRICAILGGDIQVESAIGKGSTFTVTMPLIVPVPTPTALVKAQRQEA
jgi:signal transduction histidine kinase